MSDFNDLIRRIRIFEEDHHKEILKDKQETVFHLYHALLTEMEELIKKAVIRVEIKSGKYDITIVISSSEDIFISENESFLNTLLSYADCRHIKIVEEKLVLELWFRCWKYCRTNL